MRELSGTIVPISEVTARQRDEMYALMIRYYENVGRENFEQDLTEKDCVLMLNSSEDGSVQGFSTIMVLEVRVAQNPVWAVFSGDTVIDHRYRGQLELPRTWLRYVFRKMQEFSATGRFFWFLISKGYKTYRMLPAFFRIFYPNYAIPTPPHEQEILDAFATKKFPTEYDTATGIIRYKKRKDYVRTGIADVTESHLSDPHIGFFIEKNPEYLVGNDLACLAEIKLENFTELVFTFMPSE